MSLRSLYDKYAFIVCIWVYLVQLPPVLTPITAPVSWRRRSGGGWWWPVLEMDCWYGTHVQTVSIDDHSGKPMSTIFTFFSGEIHEGLSWCKHLWIHSIFGIILYNMFKQAQKTLRCVTMLHAQVKGQTKDTSIWVRDKLRDVKW